MYKIFKKDNHVHGKVQSNTLQVGKRSMANYITKNIFVMICIISSLSLISCININVSSDEKELLSITVNDGSKDLVGTIGSQSITFDNSAKIGTTTVRVERITFSPSATANVSENENIPLTKTITITAENGTVKNYSSRIDEEGIVIFYEVGQIGCGTTTTINVRGHGSKTLTEFFRTTPNISCTASLTSSSAMAVWNLPSGDYSYIALCGEAVTADFTIEQGRCKLIRFVARASKNYNNKKNLIIPFKNDNVSQFSEEISNLKSYSKKNLY